MRWISVLTAAIALFIPLVAGAGSLARSESGGPEYRAAIQEYFSLIGRREYERAYAMMSPIKLVITDADGSGGAFQPRPGFESWLSAHQGLTDVVCDSVSSDYNQHRHEKNGKMTGDSYLGIRTYCAFVRASNAPPPSDQIYDGQGVFVSVVKGNDGRIYILGFGTGP